MIHFEPLLRSQTIWNARSVAKAKGSADLAATISTSPIAFHKPSAPSATATLGAIDRPRRLSSGGARQSRALARPPPTKPSSSLRPCGAAPMTTGMQRLVLPTRLRADVVGPDAALADES